MVSYEVSIGFVLIPVVLWAGSFNLSAIVEAQRGHIFGLVSGFGFNPLLFPLAVIFLISAMAETARAPFDLTEAESELVAGYQTEYRSMSFALFWLGEYGNVLLMCGMNAVALLGRLAAAARLGAALLDPRHLLVLRQDPVLLLRLLLGEGDRAALPLRPADAARLEDLPADLADLGVPGLGLSDADAAGMLPWLSRYALALRFARSRCVARGETAASEPVRILLEQRIAACPGAERRPCVFEQRRLLSRRTAQSMSFGTLVRSYSRSATALSRCR